MLSPVDLDVEVNLMRVEIEYVAIERDLPAKVDTHLMSPNPRPELSFSICHRASQAPCVRDQVISVVREMSNDDPDLLPTAVPQVGNSLAGFISAPTQPSPFQGDHRGSRRISNYPTTRQLAA